MDRKGILVHDIQYVIAKNGTFSIEEALDIECPRIETRGNLDSYIESLREDSGIVVTYDYNGDIVDSYRLSYSDMSSKELGQVLDVCLQYQKLQADLD